MRTTQAMVHHPSVIHSIIHFACWPCNSKYAERVNCTAKFTTPCHVRGMRLLNTIKLKNIYVPMRAGGTFTAQATKRLKNQPDYSSRINWAVSVTKQRKTCYPAQFSYFFEYLFFAFTASQIVNHKVIVRQLRFQCTSHC